MMKNGLIQLAGALALAAVLGKFYAVPLIAQVRAALVKNIDERGRSPYTVAAKCGGGESGNLSCIGDFPAISANKRFVVEYINGNVEVSQAAEFERARLHNFQGETLELVPVYESTNTQRNRYTISMPVVWYYEAGNRTYFLLESVNRANYFTGELRLAGYLIDLTQ